MALVTKYWRPSPTDCSIWAADSCSAPAVPHRRVTQVLDVTVSQGSRSRRRAPVGARSSTATRCLHRRLDPRPRTGAFGRDHDGPGHERTGRGLDRSHRPTRGARRRNLVHPVDTADVAALGGAHVARAVRHCLDGAEFPVGPAVPIVGDAPFTWVSRSLPTRTSGPGPRSYRDVGRRSGSHTAGDSTAGRPCHRATHTSLAGLPRTCFSRSLGLAQERKSG